MIYVAREENSIISERNAGDSGVSVGDAKHGELGRRRLLIVVKFVLVRRRNTTLFQASGVKDWPH